MRHHKIHNFRGIERFADVTNLDRGSLSKAVNAATLPRGAISSGPIWRNVSGLPNYLDAFKRNLDWVPGASIDCVDTYDRARIGFPHTTMQVLSHKGALFMAGDPDAPSRVWIAEPGNKREKIMDGLESAILSHVDILNKGHYPHDLVIRALSVYGAYILVHHDYGITALHDIDNGQDPVTGYRVRQSHTPADVGAANHNCTGGDIYLGYDGQIYTDFLEAAPPNKYETRDDRSPSYKSAGGYEHLLASGWQADAYAQWVPSLGLLVCFIKLAATDDYGYFLFHRPTLTLSGPFSATNFARCGIIQGTDTLVVKLADDSYTYTDLGDLRDRDLDPDQVEVSPPAGGMVTSLTDAEIEFNWEDLSEPNLHKTVDELQVNFQYGSQGSVAMQIENERGVISGNKNVYQSFDSTKERIKFFTNINGRRFRLTLYIRSSNGQPWVLRDISIGFIPGLEL